VEEKLAPDLVESLCLDDDQLQELNLLARRCEEVYGAGRDVEWAFADGRLYLLQCRAITKVGT
jgi:pyruvate,water dikinase